MADESVILREYLIALGMKVDQTAAKKFGGTLATMDKGATKLSRSIVGIGVAATAMTAEFAFRMEKLFYTSKLAETAAGNLQALNFGGKQVGVANMADQVTALARAVRANPGLQGLLNSLGVKVTGRDKADVLTDLVGQLRKMPFYISQRYAGMFGIDPDTLLLMQDGLDKMKEAQKVRADAARDMGVDTDQAVRAGLEYAQQWREVLMYVGLFKDALTIQMLPQMRELASVTKQVLVDWIRLVNTPRENFLQDLAVGAGVASPGGGVQLTPEQKARLGQEDDDGKKWRGESWVRKLFPWAVRQREDVPKANSKMDPAAVEAATAPDSKLLGQSPSPALPAGPRVAAASADKQTLMQELEKRYALPTGLLDRVWKKESLRGDPRFMESSAGAQGHFGFMPPTAKQYGVKDPNDFQQSATGSAKYFADLLKKYGGDDKFAAAAYNWGPGNLDKAMAKAMEKNPQMSQMELDRYVLGNVPKETRDYVNSVAPGTGARGAVTLNAETTIHVHGGDSRDTAAQVADQQKQVYSDTVRQLTQRIQ